MMTGWPTPWDSFWITTRVTPSVDPPGGNGTIRRMGRLGYGWACAVNANASSTIHKSIGLRTRMLHGERPAPDLGVEQGGEFARAAEPHRHAGLFERGDRLGVG